MNRLACLCSRIALLLCAGTLLVACTEDPPASDSLYRAVDELYDAVVAGTDRFQVIAEIDHSRLAAAEGEVMPPARVVIFSDPGVNTAILQREPLAGLDLPFRVLAYAEGDSPAIIHTTANFLERRHGLADGPGLRRYQEYVLETIRLVPGTSITAFDSDAIGKGEGMVTLDSGYDFDETVKRLKDAILAEADTVWFGEIDYREEAAALGVTLPPLKLLLWGAPAPGAKAMREFPRMGLDAFCQKTLVHQAAGAQVIVVFNDMTAFAEMHYGDSALPHRVISKRMQKTLGGAVDGENP